MTFLIVQIYKSFVGDDFVFYYIVLYKKFPEYSDEASKSKRVSKLGNI